MFIPSQVHHKLRLNVGLTDQEESQVKRAMSQSVSRLDAIESETVRLLDRLTLLNQRKKDTEHLIKVRQGLLSPIRRLHPDILTEIFCRCLPVAHNSVLSFKEAPLLLGRVCSHWRQIAYSTPALWSSLHFVITPLSNPGAEARLEAIETWLSRSGVLPLSISMSSLLDYDVYSHEFHSYFKLVVKHVSRWKYVYLEVEPLDQTDLLPEITADDLPLLEVFSIRTDNGSARSLLKRRSILTAPSLRVVSVHEPSLRLLDLPTQWSKLTGLDLAVSVLSDIPRLLSLCPNLQTCALNVGSLYYQSPPVMEEFLDLGPKINLPQLITLTAYGMQSSYTTDLLVIFDNLFAPALRHFECRLTYLSPPPISTPPHPEYSSSSKRFGRFFQRLNEQLEELEFYDLSGESSDLMEILYLCPRLKRLSLRCSFYTSYSFGRLFNDRLLLKFIPHGHKSHCQTCSRVEEPEGEGEGEVGGSDLVSPTSLCPKLEVLNIDGANFSRHILLEFLRSRLVDYDKYGIARLRRFSIKFDSRWDDEDMKKDIDLLAEKSGSLVKLEQTPTTPPTRWLSPRPPAYRDPFIETLPGF